MSFLILKSKLYLQKWLYFSHQYYTGRTYQYYLPTIPVGLIILVVQGLTDCAVLNSSSSDTFETVSQNQSFNFPNLLSPGLKIAHLSCCSLLSIADEVFDLFIHNCMDVFAVSEIWLDSSIDDHEIFLAPHLSLQHGMIKIVSGGVTFLLSSIYFLRPDLSEGHMEAIWIELFQKTKVNVVMLCLPSRISNPNTAV